MPGARGRRRPRTGSNELSEGAQRRGRGASTTRWTPAVTALVLVFNAAIWIVGAELVTLVAAGQIGALPALLLVRIGSQLLPGNSLGQRDGVTGGENIFRIADVGDRKVIVYLGRRVIEGAKIRQQLLLLLIKLMHPLSVDIVQHVAVRTQARFFTEPGGQGSFGD